MAVTLGSVIKYQTIGSVYGISELWDGHSVVWLEDDSGLTESSGNVTKWTDIANGYELISYASDGSAGGASNYPTWTAAGGVAFDGASEVLKVLVSGWTTFGSVYAVIKQLGWTNSDRLFSYAGTGSISVAQKNTSPNIYLSHASGDSAAGTTLATNTWGIIRLRVNAVATDSCVMVINGGSDLTNSTDMAGFTSAGVILGAVHAAAPALQRYGAVAIKAIIFRDQVDDSTTETAIYDYLADKYATELLN
jgi:hypothetical protein